MVYQRDTLERSAGHALPPYLDSSYTCLAVAVETVYDFSIAEILKTAFVLDLILGAHPDTKACFGTASKLAYDVEAFAAAAAYDVEAFAAAAFAAAALTLEAFAA